MPANQSTKTKGGREFRELDLSISSNLSEREGKKERTVGANGRRKTIIGERKRNKQSVKWQFQC